MQADSFSLSNDHGGDTVTSSGAWHWLVTLGAWAVIKRLFTILDNSKVDVHRDILHKEPRSSGPIHSW